MVVVVVVVLGRQGHHDKARRGKARKAWRPRGPYARTSFEIIRRSVSPPRSSLVLVTSYAFHTPPTKPSHEQQAIDCSVRMSSCLHVMRLAMRAHAINHRLSVSGGIGGVLPTRYIPPLRTSHTTRTPHLPWSVDPIFGVLFYSCLILSCPILSYPVLSCPILSYPVLSCPILSCLVGVLTWIIRAGHARAHTRSTLNPQQQALKTHLMHMEWAGCCRVCVML